MRPVFRQRMIYVQCAAAQPAGRIDFPEQQDLKKILCVDAIETFIATDIVAAPSGQAIVSAADAVKVALVFTEGSTEKVKEVPYLGLRTAANAGQLREYIDLKPEWTQCYARVTQAFAAATISLLAVLVSYHYAEDGR